MNTPMNKIGKYEITRAIGQGASSTVYLGYDPFAKRDVAIKVVFPQILKDPERGKLSTPTFSSTKPRWSASSTTRTSCRSTMRWSPMTCATSSWNTCRAARSKPCDEKHLLPVERVVEIIFKCTRALDFAFRLGITHRDIKPANILTVGGNAASGDIKISDFGAAITGGVDHTQVSGIGSPAYMSPQQVKEQPLDHRTDIYSLGVVMYQMLTGQVPFQASNNYNMVYQIINTPPTAVSQLRKAIPPAIDGIVSKAMAKELEDRYQTWEEFAHDLAQAFRNKAVKAPTREFAESEKFDTLRAALLRRLQRRRDMGSGALLAMGEHRARRRDHARRRAGQLLSASSPKASSRSPSTARFSTC